jgi:hypothetical protein
MDNVVISLILMAVGMAGLLAGYKIFKLFLAVSAFIFAFNLAFSVLPQMDYTVRIVLCVVAGAIAGILCFYIYKVGVFLIWTALAMEVARLGIDHFGWNLGANRDLAIIVIGVIVGGAALVFEIEKLAIIVATSVAGAGYVVLGLTPFIHKEITFSSFLNIFSNLSGVLQKDNVLTVIFVVLLVIGLVVQVRSNLEKSDEKIS